MDCICIKSFEQLKNQQECKILDDNIINFILNSFDFMDNKKTKKYYNIKKINSIIKNSKIRLVKDKISNKINLILNKLSENNLENLLIEFFQNIKIVNLEDYNEFIKTIYVKMLSESNFLKLYFDFFKIVTQTYKSIFNWNFSYFYDLVENKFKFDYFEIDNNNWDFLKEYDTEVFRINNLNIIKEMLNQNMLNIDFLEVINKELLTQTKNISDIYYWFKDTKLTSEYNEIICNILKNDVDIRGKILLETLITDTNEPKKNKIIFKKKQIIPEKNSEKNLEKNLEKNPENIITEYLINKNLNILHEFIEQDCNNTIEKNKFCEILVKLYFNSDITEDEKYMNLFILLINEQILYKSNFSRGLLNSALSYNSEKEKKLLLTLKSLGITKGLEQLLTKYKIL